MHKNPSFDKVNTSTLCKTEKDVGTTLKCRTRGVFRKVLEVSENGFWTNQCIYCSYLLFQLRSESIRIISFLSNTIIIIVWSSGVKVETVCSTKIVMYR